MTGLAGYRGALVSSLLTAYTLSDSTEADEATNKNG